MAKESKSGGKFKKFLTDKKYRPFLIGGIIVIGAIVLLSLMRPKQSSSGASVPTSGGPSQVEAGLIAQSSAFQHETDLANLGAAVEMNKLAAQQNIAQTQASTALEIAKLETMYKAFETEKLLDTQSQIELGRIASANYQAAQEAEIAFGQQGVQALAIKSAERVRKREIRAEEYAVNKYAYNQFYALSRAKKKHVSAVWAGESAQLGTKTNAITGLIGGIAGIFSDLRVKNDIQWSGIYDGENRYTYFNEKTGAIEAGVMAQEVNEHYHVPMGGFLGNVMGVDYVALTADKEKASG